MPENKRCSLQAFVPVDESVQLGSVVQRSGTVNSLLNKTLQWPAGPLIGEEYII